MEQMREERLGEETSSFLGYVMFRTFMRRASGDVWQAVGWTSLELQGEGI